MHNAVGVDRHSQLDSDQCFPTRCFPTHGQRLYHTAPRGVRALGTRVLGWGSRIVLPAGGECLLFCCALLARQFMCVLLGSARCALQVISSPVPNAAAGQGRRRRRRVRLHGSRRPWEEEAAAAPAAHQLQAAQRRGEATVQRLPGAAAAAAADGGEGRRGGTGTAHASLEAAGILRGNAVRAGESRRRLSVRGCHYCGEEKAPTSASLPPPHTPSLRPLFGNGAVDSTAESL
jgi:hypothetical protein